MDAINRAVPTPEVEIFCIRGARKLLSERRIDFLQFEFNFDWEGITLVAAASFLSRFGYKLFQLHSKGLRKVDIRYFGGVGIGNWLALHDGSPDLGFGFVQ